MNKKCQSYEDDIADSQNLGFAEANPTADVEGLDAARKMVILARLSFLTYVELDDVDVEGISELSIIDLDYGKKLDLTMKLIVFANRHDQQVEVIVQPTFVSIKYPLSTVKNE